MDSSIPEALLVPQCQYWQREEGINGSLAGQISLWRKKIKDHVNTGLTNF